MVNLFDSVHSEDLKVVGEGAHRVLLVEIDYEATEKRALDLLMESINNSKKYEHSIEGAVGI